MAGHSYAHSGCAFVRCMRSAKRAAGEPRGSRRGTSGTSVRIEMVRKVDYVFDCGRSADLRVSRAEMPQSASLAVINASSSTRCWLSHECGFGICATSVLNS